MAIISLNKLFYYQKRIPEHIPKTDESPVIFKSTKLKQLI